MEKLHAEDRLVENEARTSFWDFKGKYDFVDQWFLMGTPYPLLLITAAYLLFVLKLGPSYLKNRRPFELKNVLLVYNIFQVGLSAYMVYVCSEVMLKVGPVQRTCLTDTEESINRLTTLTYYYFSCKITELLDTVFFVLRKKQNQVTFLHVYHHTMMMWNGWAFLKYEPGYWMLFLGTMNCFVHVVMYAYYGLSAYPSLHKYLWWKKYITSLQLIQFGLLLVQMTVNLFVNECKPSKWTILYLYFNALLFIYLFSRFYKKSYSKDKKIDNDNAKIKGVLNKPYENVTKQRSIKKNGDYFINGAKYQNGISGEDAVDARAKLKNRN